MPADLYTAVMSIPGADQALTFLQEQASAFAYVPARLDTFRRELEELRTRFAARNDAVGVAKVAAALAGLQKLQSLYASASGKVSEVMTAFRLGVANPLPLVPKVLTAAGEAALVFKSLNLFENAINKLAAGTLTAAELARIKQGGYSAQTVLTPTVKVVLFVGGAWLVYRLIKGR
jgi:hypothetical protein